MNTTTQHRDEQDKQPYRLLIADDNPTTRASIRALLETAPQAGNAIIDEAANGQEAIKMSKTHQPTLILMDVQMPVLNGIEATRIIKQRWPTIKIVVLTLSAAHQSAALSAGADQFLLKSGSPDQLLTAVFTPNG